MFHCGSEVWLEIDGKKYRLPRFVRRLHREWYLWALQQIPDPLEVVSDALPHIPPELHEAVITQADQDACRRFNLGHEDIETLLASREGMLFAFRLLLREYHPGISQEQAEQLFDRLPDPGDVLLKTTGKVFKTEYEHEQEMFREAGLLPPIFAKRAPEQAFDWGSMDRKVFQNYHITPSEMDELTLPEILTIIQNDEEPKVDATPQSLEAVIAEAQRYHRLTPEQKLELSRKKYRL
jgi:hypothetical protein